MGDELRQIRDNYEEYCSNSECTSVLLEREREVLMEYVSTEFMDRRAMELARCFVQNVIRSKKDKAIKQFALIPRQALTGRVNPERNMISDLKECDKAGISAVISHARFMGSLATVLKCNSSLLKMDTIRRLLNDADWRFSSSFNTAQQDAIDDLLEVFHNYIVGVLVGNPIRTWSPNVRYLYGLYASQDPKTMRRDFCTILEKIPSLPRQATIGDMVRMGRLTPDLFLSVLGQLSLTLEMMQAKYGFVHFDLTTDNIMMRPVYEQSMTWSYLVYGNEYKLKGIQFIATIINLGSSCFDPSLLETGVVAMTDAFVGRGSFKKLGVMDFMIPGYDLYVFLNQMRVLILSTMDTANMKNFVMDPYAQENNVMILDFIDYIFLTFYEVPEAFVARDVPVEKLHNVLLYKGAGISPLSLLARLDDATIKKKLQISKPWTVDARRAFLPAFCKKKIPAFLADIMPNWKKIVEEDRFFHPVAMTPSSDILADLDTMIDIVKNKKMFYEFDVRPLMMAGDQVSTNAMDFYDRLVFQKDGIYYGFFQNTVLFYNTALRFLDTYYYTFYIHDKEYLQIFAENQDKVSMVFQYLQKPEFMPKIASMMRFGQTIVNLKLASEKKFCCTAARQSLGSLAQAQSIGQQKQKNTTLQVDPDIYKIQAQKAVCTNQNQDPLLTPDVYPLQRKPPIQQIQQTGIKMQQIQVSSPPSPPSQQKRQQNFIMPSPQQQGKKQQSFSMPPLPQAPPSPQLQQQPQAPPQQQPQKRQQNFSMLTQPPLQQQKRQQNFSIPPPPPPPSAPQKRQQNFSLQQKKQQIVSMPPPS